MIYYSSKEVFCLEKTFNLNEKLIRDLSSKHLSTIIRDCITPENKYNCISFIIIERPTIFEAMLYNNYVDLEDMIECALLYPKCISKLPQEILKNEIFIKKIIENVQPEWYDFLPPSLANNPEVQRKCNRSAKIYQKNGLDKNGYSRDWLNLDGELISFFKLEADFPIRSKLDYYKLYKEYIESKLSVHSFCVKYGIDSVNGFNDFLKRVEAESLEDSYKIKEVKTEVSSRFYITSREFAKKIVEGKISLEEFFEKIKFNFDSTNINLYFSFLSSNEKNKFSLLIMDYVEQHPYLISKDFIKFLTVNKIKPSDSYNTFVRRNLLMPKDMEYIQKYRKQISVIKGYEKVYRRSDLYCTYIIDGKEFKIDDSVIDQAYAYANDKKYHICYKVMDYLCKQIVSGKINYSEETSKEKKEMIGTIITLIKEEKTIEDYITEMKCKSFSTRK